MRWVYPWEGFYLQGVGDVLTESGWGEPERMGTPPAWVEEARAWVEEALQGRVGPVPEIPIEVKGTKFQKQVWEAVKAIPPGEVRTYGEIAQTLGCKSSQAVGQALGANPLPVFIPCHRVVGRAGLGGFCRGYGEEDLSIKAGLLQAEGVDLARWRR